MITLCTVGIMHATYTYTNLQHTYTCMTCGLALGFSKMKAFCVLFLALRLHLYASEAKAGDRQVHQHDVRGWKSIDRSLKPLFLCVALPVPLF